jgi:hypothetical protein
MADMDPMVDMATTEDTAPLQVQEDTMEPGILATQEDLSAEYLTTRAADLPAMAPVMYHRREVATQFQGVRVPGLREQR